LVLSLVAVSIVKIERAANNPLDVKVDVSDGPVTVKATPKLTLRGSQQMIALDSAVKLLLLVLVITVITIRVRPTAVDWGWTLTHWREDLRTGAVTFLAIFLPMIALQSLLVVVFEWKYEHPLIELVTQTKDSLLFSLAGIAAAVVAPLFEEFVFRGLLQGWLEKFFAGHATGDQLLTGGVEQVPVESLDAKSGLEPRSFDPNPYAPPQFVDERASPTFSSYFTPPTWRDPLAIVISMLVFSMLHYSHGPAWIPLLIFGAATGFVYQRTHRLWPGIFAHVLLNTTTMFGLWVQVFAK
jgi:membrane protease YdiL (CAAX protease family)